MNINLIISVLVFLTHDACTKDTQEVELSSRWQWDNLLRKGSSNKPAPVYLLMMRGLPRYNNLQEYNLLPNIPLKGPGKNRGKISDNNYLILKKHAKKKRKKYSKKPSRPSTPSSDTRTEPGPNISPHIHIHIHEGDNKNTTG